MLKNSKINNRILLLFVLSVISLLKANSQETIKGKIMDKESNPVFAVFADDVIALTSNLVQLEARVVLEATGVELVSGVGRSLPLGARHVNESALFGYVLPLLLVLAVNLVESLQHCLMQFFQVFLDGHKPLAVCLMLNYTLQP